MTADMCLDTLVAIEKKFTTNLNSTHSSKSAALRFSHHHQIFYYPLFLYI